MSLRKYVPQFIATIGVFASAYGAMPNSVPESVRLGVAVLAAVASCVLIAATDRGWVQTARIALAVVWIVQTGDTLNDLNDRDQFMKAVTAFVIFALVERIVSALAAYGSFKCRPALRSHGISIGLLATVLTILLITDAGHTPPEPDPELPAPEPLALIRLTLTISADQESVEKASAWAYDCVRLKLIGRDVWIIRNVPPAQEMKQRDIDLGVYEAFVTFYHQDDRAAAQLIVDLLERSGVRAKPKYGPDPSKRQLDVLFRSHLRERLGRLLECRTL
jgi:hypothetical protein